MSQAEPRMVSRIFYLTVFYSVGFCMVSLLLLPLGGGYGKNITSPQRPPHVELPNLVIFYHIFVPPGSNEAERTKEIVREQLIDLGSGLSTSPGSPAATVYYTVVGQEIETDFISMICRDFATQISSCTMLQHTEADFEEYTLQPLFEHCQVHPDHRVIYMHTKGSHTKGSHHPSEYKDHWRRHLTQALVSPDCIVSAVNEQCDMCGLLFWAQPSFHFTGNMFNAQCSYIRRLIPPIEFRGRMDNVVDTVRGLIENGTLTTKDTGLGHDPWSMETGRFAMTYWSGSHPSLERVCDLANRREREFWEDLPVEAREPEDWEFRSFPRGPVWCPDLEANQHYCFLDFEERKKMIFLLPGRIFIWDFLYGEVPAQSSWTWSAYPDGHYWRHQVKNHGSRVIGISAAATDSFNDLWNGRVKSTVNRHKPVNASLVISYCSGNLHWLENYTNGFVFDRTYVATKCAIPPDKDTLPEGATLAPLPNVGGCDHTMAYWMSEVLPTLPRTYDRDEVVVFLKDNLIRGDFTLRDFKTVLEIALSEQGFGCFFELPSGFSFYHDLKILRTFFYASHVRVSLKGAHDKGAVAGRNFKSSYETLGDWHRALDITLEGPYVPVCYGGMYIVKRSKIEQVPLEILRNLTLSVSRDDNIEEGHFAERTWAALFMDNLSIKDQLRLHERRRHANVNHYGTTGALMNF